MSITGLELSYWSAIFITSVGHIQEFTSGAKRLTGLCGMLIGAGEIVGLYVSFSTSFLVFSSEQFSLLIYYKIQSKVSSYCLGYLVFCNVFKIFIFFLYFLYVTTFGE